MDIRTYEELTFFNEAYRDIVKNTTGRYELLRVYRNNFAREGVNQNEVFNRITDSGENVELIQLDDETRNHLNKLGFEDYIGYATTPTILEKKIEIIREVGLQNCDQLLLVLLAVAPWGIETSSGVEGRIQYNLVNHNRSVKHYEEMRKQVKDVKEILNLLPIEDEAVSGGKGIQPTTWLLKSVDFVFYNKETKSRKIEFDTADYSNVIKDLLLDYIRLLDEKSTTINNRLLLEENYVNSEPIPNLANQHHKFTYKFITLLENNLNLVSILNPSRNQILKIYDSLLKSTGNYDVNVAKDASSTESIRQWYNFGKI